MSKQQNILWIPTEDFIKNSNLYDYQCWLEKRKNLFFKKPQDLWQWSANNVDDFWESIWEYFEIIYYSPYNKVTSGHEMPGVKWFEGASLNYAEHIFRKKSDRRDALIFQNENSCRKVSWLELEEKVKAFRSYLVKKDIKKGDCVAAYLPNIPEAIIAFLAVNSIGAIWSCCSPDFGVETVIERFEQIHPKLLIAADGYHYNTKRFDRRSNVREIFSRIESIAQLVIVPYLDIEEVIENSDDWNQILLKNTTEEKLRFTPVPFDHPIWVLYSSGTTGKPKAITHSHGGVLLEHLKYMTFHNDVKEGENFFWFTTTGWMMWNFLQASMLAGGTPVIFDGSPGYPTLEILWEIAEKFPIHHFGTSAPYLTACMKQDLKIGDKFDLSQLRSIGSTGAPLPPEVFEWVYKNVKKDVWLCSMSGGTDVCTAFVGGHPYKDVQKGKIQSRALGCAMYAYDENGNHIEDSLGEMVIEKPMPSMPIYFWNDKNNERYLKSYFEDYPGKWRHGDWIKLFEDGSLIIQGRSDATLNRKGIRIGTAEIYNVLEGISGIDDSLILNLEKSDGEDIMPLFVVLKKGEKFDDTLKTEINKQLKNQCSPRHVPDEIFLAPDIPYTLSGKKMEVPIKKIFMGMNVSASMNRDAVRNPEAIDWFVEFARKY